MLKDQVEQNNKTDSGFVAADSSELEDNAIASSSPKEPSVIKNRSLVEETDEETESEEV